MKNEKNTPLWFKLWVYDADDIIEMLDDEEDPEIKECMYISIGKAIEQAIRYHKNGAEDLEKFERIGEPSGRILLKKLKRWIDDSYLGYEERAEKNRENGKKGGRPPKSDKVIDLAEAEQTRKEEEQRNADMWEKIHKYADERSG